MILLAYRELDDALGLSDLAGGASIISDGRRGKNIRHLLTELFRQSVFGQLAGSASRLAHDPAMRASRSFMRRIEMMQPETPGAQVAEKHLRGGLDRGVPIPHAEAIFAAIELALAVQSGQFAPADGSESPGPAKELSR